MKAFDVEEFPPDKEKVVPINILSPTILEIAELGIKINFNINKKYKKVFLLLKSNFKGDILR